MDLFRDFIQSCVFIHDDTDSSAGVDWDQHGTNPFLLGADICVTGTLDGFGESYLNYLRRLGILPPTLIIPKHNHQSLADSLISDQETFMHLKRIMHSTPKDISVFYADVSKTKVLSKLSSEQNAIKIHPDPLIYELANSKLHMHRLLSGKVPLPEGHICSSINDVVSFLKEVRNYHQRILIKKNHWDTISIRSMDDLRAVEYTIKFPVIAEVAYEITNSPVIHNIVWNNQVKELFTVEQSINNLLHAGNFTPVNISSEQHEMISDYANTVIEQLPGYSGVIGIDFVITSSREVYVVDVNPRFNSSTYPFYFVKRRGLLDENTYAKYGFLRCSVSKLSDIFDHPAFIPFSESTYEGILLYSPAYDTTEKVVKKVSYLCISRTRANTLRLEQELKRIILLSTLPRKG